MAGRVACNKMTLRPLYDRAKELVEECRWHRHKVSFELVRRDQNKRALTLARHGADPAIAAHGSVAMRVILEQGKKAGFESASCFQWAAQWQSSQAQAGGGGGGEGAAHESDTIPSDSYFYESGRRTSIRPLGPYAGTDMQACSVAAEQEALLGDDENETEAAGGGQQQGEDDG